MHVGERIQERMNQKRISQNRLAKLAQISQSGLSSIISGSVSPKENTLQAIASALECSVSDLLGETSSNQSDGTDEVWNVRERIRRDPNMRILFDAASKATPEQLKAAASMLRSFQGDNDEA